MFDPIVGIAKESGYVGIAFLMLLENLFPPIPSELINAAARRPESTREAE